MALDLVKYYTEKNRTMIREWTTQASKLRDDDDSAIVNDAIDYFDRQNDIAQIRDKMKARFATGIAQDSSNADQTTSGNYEYYTRGKQAAAIDGDFYETVSTGIGNQIAKTIASLFTADDQSWSFLQNDTPDDTTADIVELMREKGGFYTKAEAVDFTSCCINCAIMHVYWSSDELNYDLVLPGSIRFLFGDTVLDGDVYRPTNREKIEDATAIIIETGNDDQGGDARRSFLAYIGANERYPDGRMVSYRADDYLPIPDIGADNITSEYSHDGSAKPANPMTYLKNHGTGKTGWAWPYEYPISIFYGGISTINRKKEILPTSTTLYEVCLELELMYSALLKTARDNARGKDVITLTDASAEISLPKSLDIPVMKPGQTYEVKGRAAKESLDAMEVLKFDVQAVAAGYSVPGYMLIGAGSAGSVESGISLAIQTAPLEAMRQRRIRINKQSVRRVFEIEKALLAEYFAANTPIDPKTEQSWNPGTMGYPQPETERLAAITASRDAGYIDHFEATRQALKLSTISEAEEIIRQYVERDADYDSPFIEQETVEAEAQEQLQSPIAAPPEPDTEEDEEIEE